MKQYALLNPKTGLYELFASKDEAVPRFAEIALSLMLEHTHDNPFTIVQTNEDGLQTWTAPDGTDITDYIKEQNEMMNILNSSQEPT
jgi:hypothetical protein